jgi:hypothetical protein
MSVRAAVSFTLAYVVATSYARGASTAKPGADWPQFRGIAAQGISEGFKTPSVWNVAEHRNVRWKAELPGLGLSSPVIWGDLLCVTTAISGRKDAGIKAGY